MDFSLSKEQRMIQNMAREFSEKNILPAAQQIEKENKIPEEILKGLGELGLFGIAYPEEYGGGGAGYEGYVLSMEQIGKVCGGVAMTISGHCMTLSTIMAFGTEEQKKKYMTPACLGEQILSVAFTEPGTGSDPKQLTTTAVKKGDKYIINGTKRFITNANWPGSIMVFAVDSETKKPTAFMLDKWCEGYSISEQWDKIGMHGGMLLDVYLKDVVVPAENILAGPGMGYPILQLGISYGKVGVCSITLGAMLSAYEEAMKYAQEKMHRDKPIAKFQATQLRLANIALKYEASKWMTYRLGWMANNVKDPIQFAKEAALTKTFVAETVIDVVKDAMAIHGSYGLINDYKIAQLWRDAIIAPQIEGVTDVQKTIAASIMLGRF